MLMTTIFLDISKYISSEWLLFCHCYHMAYNTFSNKLSLTHVAMAFNGPTTESQEVQASKQEGEPDEMFLTFPMTMRERIMCRYAVRLCMCSVSYSLPFCFHFPLIFLTSQSRLSVGGWKSVSLESYACQACKEFGHVLQLPRYCHVTRQGVTVMHEGWFEVHL